MPAAEGGISPKSWGTPAVREPSAVVRTRLARRTAEGFWTAALPPLPRDAPRHPKRQRTAQCQRQKGGSPPKSLGYPSSPRAFGVRRFRHSPICALVRSGGPSLFFLVLFRLTKGSHAWPFAPNLP